MDPQREEVGSPAREERPGVGRGRGLRRRHQFALDLLILAGALVASYLLRFDFAIPRGHRVGLAVQLPVVVLVQFVTLQLLGAYNFVWRYVGMAELQTFLRAALYSTLPLTLLRLGLPARLQEWKTPFSIIVLDAVLAFGGLLSIRVLRRWVYERFERVQRESGRREGELRRVLLVGAGRAGVLAAKEILGRGDLEIAPVGFVDDDLDKQGAVLQGLRVLGTSDDIGALAKRMTVDHAIITIANADASTIRALVEKCEKADVRVRIIPGLYEILEGSVGITRIRDVSIEDLLGRAPVRLDEERMRAFLEGKRVLVTGAGGSIGSELTRQLRRFEPREMVLVDRAEGALFEIDRELRSMLPSAPVVSRVADVGDRSAMSAILRFHRPEVVLHAAAHKHVPLMEDNVSEAVRNNVLATETLARMAAESGVEVFVMLSTDKAVRPSSVMGASKRFAELVLQRLDGEYRETRFVAVRFGNVMGSAGSVVPIFREQIARGGPVTVTSREATRYFMTIPEAAQLVLQAGSLAHGGEIMILEMGEPIRIWELARDMIRLSGLVPDRDIAIEVVGLRPGEKLYEELLYDRESADPTRHEKILVARIDEADTAAVDGALAQLRTLCEQGLDVEIRGFLNRVLPEAGLREDASLTPGPMAPGDGPSPPSLVH